MMKLVVKAYGKIYRKEKVNPPKFTDNPNWQEMMFSYGRVLQIGGYAEGELPWTVCTGEGVYSDETMMKASIETLIFGE